ncbi:PKD domain-containing protein [Brumimicrobium mesophilum]|uniref:PKD domain-containing protein n=1 Tax=Brumimicrobium mesophilum TaxID=392717 RepID=UPI000D14395D|nr:PKD domain-containing protein [Brumimicrobium mesophilum]
MFKNLIIIPLVILLSSLATFAQPGLVFPKANYVFDSTTIYFEWNSVPNASSYDFQISTSANFSTLVENATSLTLTNFTSSQLPSNTQFYWRSKANNSSWSEVRSFRIVDFTGFSQLEMWLKADSVQTVSGNRIAEWNDLSGNSNSYLQSSPSNQPYLLPAQNSINNHNMVEFQPSGPNFFQPIDFSSLANAEIFSLIKLKNTPATSASTSGLWSFGTSASQDHYPYNNNVVYSGFGRATRFTIGDISNSIDLKKPHILNINSGSTFDFRINSDSFFSTAVGAPSFNTTVFLGRSTGSHFMDGEIGEIILFNVKLSDSLRELTHEYLRHKYAPPTNLGANISKYGFCDTTIYAGERFESYLWSDGSIADSLVVNSSGTYWVEVEDVFGFISRDTIKVNLGQLNYPLSNQYCSNDSIIWNTNLGLNYSYLWSDFSTGDTLIIDSPGDVHVVVTDTNGCIFASDTLNFTEDIFATTATLGPDTTMCSGNDIVLSSGASSATSYLWNTAETTPQLEINTSGTYSVIVQNANGCEAKDTIDVIITGDAPIVQMQIPSNACVNAPINFSDLSSTTDGSTIIGWTWAFGDGDSSTVATGNHAYSNSGMYDIDLIIETSSGCFNKLTQTIEVKENPMLTFATTNQCQFEGILFSGGQISPTTISSWDWNFADPSSGIENTANGQNTSHTFNDDGDFDVLLVGTDVFGCVDSLIQTINIVPAPTADFIFDEVCEGSIVNFQNTSTIVAPAVITGKLWDFGDGTASTQNNPQKPYSSHGIYDVELLVNSDNGCSNSITQTVKIHATPQVQHSVDQNCAGLETSFIDASFVPNGSVAQVSWRFDNQAPLNGFNITNNFSNSGIYELEHEVTSSFGCINANVSDVTINPFLNADFTFTPGAFITDYPIVFESTGSGANEYLWSFGNFATSQQADTSIVFEESQIGTTQIVQLKVENEWNCVDSMRIELPVLDQRTDLEISQLFSQEINGFLTIAVRLKNKGTTPITEVDLISQSPNTGSIKETWSGMLQANEEEIYIFSASPSAQIPAEDTIQNYLCVNGEIIQPVQFIEEDLTNNEVCKTMTENQAVIINPYPNPVKDQLTIKLVMPKKGAVTLKVYNNLGKIIHVISDKQALDKGLTVFVLETSSWANGNYRIVYEGDGNVEAVEFVKI